jgi:hypothetical protein
VERLDEQLLMHEQRHGAILSIRAMSNRVFNRAISSLLVMISQHTSYTLMLTCPALHLATRKISGMATAGKSKGGLAKALNKVEDLRRIADYKGDALTLAAAEWAVERTQIFLIAVLDSGRWLTSQRNSFSQSQRLRQ